jgi:hypothetical protein
VPLRQEERIGANALNPAFSNDSSDRAEKDCPYGSSITWKTEASLIPEA